MRLVQIVLTLLHLTIVRFYIACQIEIVRHLVISCRIMKLLVAFVAAIARYRMCIAVFTTEDKIITAGGASFFIGCKNAVGHDLEIRHKLLTATLNRYVCCLIAADDANFLSSL